MSPVVRYSCPETAPTYGNAETPEFCITECKNRCMSPFLIAAITNVERTNHHKGRYLSATSLDGCVRKLVSERTIPYAEELGKLFYGFRGTLVHHVIENAADAKLLGNKSIVDYGFVSEWRMAVGFCFTHGGFPLPENVDKHDQETWDRLDCPYGDSCECIILGGTLDGLEPHWDLFHDGVLPMTLHDAKTAMEYAVVKVITGDKDAKLHAEANGIETGHFKDSYVLQAQVYKYLAERDTPPPELVARGVERIEIIESRLQYFAMGSWPYSGSKYKYRKHYKHKWSHWDIPTIEFFEDKWIESEIKKRAWPIYQSLILGNERGDICEPATNSEGSHSWTCNYCAFHKTEVCPDPKKEWKALQKGLSKEEAFSLALQTLEEEQ